MSFPLCIVYQKKMVIGFLIQLLIRVKKVNVS
jgi:hypothetical protein